jgi:hypothetical protein
LPASEELNEKRTGKERYLSMKRFCLLVGLLGALSIAAMANPVLCVNDNSLQSYINSYNTFGNACQINDKVFWGFSLTPGPSASGTEPTASQIQVQTNLFDGFSNVGIVFNTGGWITSNGAVLDQVISYQVATISGFAAIKDATLTITGTLTGNGGSGNVTETLTPAQLGSPIGTAIPNPVSVNILFGAPVNTLAVSTEVKVVGGVGFTDFAHISIVENDFSEIVPEPFGFLLTGSGLVLLGLASRRRLGKSSVEVVGGKQ